MLFFSTFDWGQLPDPFKIEFSFDQLNYYKKKEKENIASEGRSLKGILSIYHPEGLELAGALETVGTFALGVP